MTEKQFNTDCVQLVLQGLLGRKVSIDEVIFFIESKEYGIIDYDEMWQRVWEQFHTGDVPLHLIPLEVMLFRMSEHCITPKSKLEDCLWLDINNLEVYVDEIEVLLNGRFVND